VKAELTRKVLVIGIGIGVFPSLGLAGGLPLQDGKYAEAESPCNNAETIATLKGGYFVYPPYEGNCTDHIQQKSTHVYEIVRKCDGGSIVTRITVVKPTEYERWDKFHQIRMRWCHR
jgi:hypothetical protein